MSEGKKVSLSWTPEQPLGGDGSEPARRNLYTSLQQIVAALNLQLVGEGNLDEALALKVGEQPFSAFPDMLTVTGSVDTTAFCQYGGVAGAFGNGNVAGGVTTITVGNEVDTVSGRPVYYVQFSGSITNGSLGVAGSQAIRIPKGFTRWETAALRVQHRMSTVAGVDRSNVFSVTVRNTPPQVAASITKTRTRSSADAGYEWIEFSSAELEAWGAGDPLVFEFDFDSTGAAPATQVLRIAAIEFNWR